MTLGKIFIGIAILALIATAASLVQAPVGWVGAAVGFIGVLIDG